MVFQTGIDFDITQKGLLKKSRKAIPLDILLGDNLQYGTYGKGKLTNEHSDDQLTAILPDALGRGIWVRFKEENKGLRISLPTPCHDRELDELFNMIFRIAQYWNCTILWGADRKKFTLFDLKRIKQSAQIYNKECLIDIVEEILDYPYQDNGEPTVCNFIGGWHHVAFGPKEAEKFIERPTCFSEWLHEVQAAKASYCYPDFYEWTKGCITGQYDLIPGGFSFLLPYTPFALSYDIFKKTGEPAHADTWEVCFTNTEPMEEMGKLPYDVFLEALAPEDMVYHDAHCFMLPNLTYDKIQRILENGNAILSSRKENISDEIEDA